MTTTAQLAGFYKYRATSVRPIRDRRDALCHLMRYGNTETPCSHFGRRTADVAEVAWRASYVLRKVSGEPITTDTLDAMMGRLVNDSTGDTIRDLITQHGHGMYR